MLNFYTVLPFLLFNPLGAELHNPCPNILKYVHKSELSQLTAVIQLQSKEDLQGIFLNIKFNYNELLSVSSDVGKFTSDNTSFTVLNPTFELKANVVRPVNVEVTYNATIGAPIITSINLSGRTICKDNTQSKQSEDNVILCGSSKVPKTLSTGDVKKGYYQWLAAIYVNSSNLVELQYRCVGTLVHKQFIITTSSCFFETVAEQGILEMVAYFGKQYGINLTSPELQVRNVIFGKFFGAKTDKLNDIAVFKLEKPVELTDYVYPICLWYTDPNEKIYQPGVVVGWLVTFPSITNPDQKYTEELKMYQTYIMDKQKCIDQDPDTLRKYYKDNIYCGGFVNKTQKTFFPCGGSSGSTMVFQDPRSDPENPTWMLRGIFTTRGNNICLADTATLYVDIVKYYEFIFKSITEMLAIK